VDREKRLRRWIPIHLFPPGGEALDNSLSSFVSCLLQQKRRILHSSNGEKNSSHSYKEEEDGGSLSDDSDEVIPILAPLAKSICSQPDEALRKQGEIFRASGNSTTRELGLYLSFSFPNSSLATGFYNKQGRRN
jgi:hypothetical protein